MSDEAKFKQAIAQLNELREERGIDINGKLYSKVIDRIEMFRSTFGADYGIDTKVDYSSGFNNGAVVVVTAKIGDVKTGITVASGTAMCYVGSDQVTSTSPIEATETAAIGRALACFGLAGGEFASANEMEGIQDKERAVARRPNNGTNVPAEREEEGRMPDLSPTFGHYLPPKGLDLDLATETGKIADAVVHVKTLDDLNRYWTEIRDFRDYLSEVEPELNAALKAAFAVRKKNFTGDRT